MYALSQRPNKILAKTRRAGLTQKLDTLENSRDFGNKRSGDHNLAADMRLLSVGTRGREYSPKPVFHPVNGRRPHTHRNTQENVSPQQEEIIRFIHDNWKAVCREYESSKQLVDGKVPSVKYYQDKSSNSQLQNFEPFDLETFWGQRLFQNITQSA